MKAILEFDLPDDEYGFDVANNGWLYRAALVNIKNELRSKVKWGEFKHSETYEELDKLYEFVCDQLIEARIDE